jgi:hypothetical protein
MTTRFPIRSLGLCGIEVSAIGFGCMSLSGTYGAADDDASIALIREALDRGITMLDSSEMYGFGHNEELVGKAIKGRRSGVECGRRDCYATATPWSAKCFPCRVNCLDLRRAVGSDALRRDPRRRGNSTQIPEYRQRSLRGHFLIGAPSCANRHIYARS